MNTRGARLFWAALAAGLAAGLAGAGLEAVILVTRRLLARLL